MRRVILAGLLAVLAALTAARLAVERPAAAASAAARWDGDSYNVLEMDMPSQSGTPGSTLISGLDSYFLSRTPTAKGPCTGLLAGRDLLLLWRTDGPSETADGAETPALRRLREEGIQFRQVYVPDWYQGADGRRFALLSGLPPTAVGESTSMVWAGEQGTYLPFALGTCLGAMGYDCRVFPGEPGREASYEALGFAPEARPAGGDSQVLAWTLTTLDAGPFAVCVELADADTEGTMARLWQLIEETGREESTVVCLLDGGGLFLWAAGLEGLEVTGPCSELDVTPTLLDLLGAAYDSRYLFGRDLLAGESEGPVSLNGSAWADWVSDAGRYDAAAACFTPTDDRFSSAQETDRYVSRMRQTVYEQYVCARRVMECDYFRVRMSR